MIISQPFKSFQVDSLSKRWVAVLLLLFVWGVSFWFFLTPPGDSDFSQIMFWYEDMMKAEDTYIFVSQHPFNDVVTIGNLVYAFSCVAYVFFLLLSALFYFVLYVCDLREVPLKKAPKIYLSRVGWVFLFAIVAFIPILIFLNYFPFIFLFLIPACYAMAGIIFFEKKNAFSAVTGSIVATFGHKMSIFLELIVISFLYYLIMTIVRAVLTDGSPGIALVSSFVTAYFTLVVARNMGTRFHMITILKK